MNLFMIIFIALIGLLILVIFFKCKRCNRKYLIRNRAKQLRKDLNRAARELIADQCPKAWDGGDSYQECFTRMMQNYARLVMQYRDMHLYRLGQIISQNPGKRELAVDMYLATLEQIADSKFRENLSLKEIGNDISSTFNNVGKFVQDIPKNFQKGNVGGIVEDIGIGLGAAVAAPLLPLAAGTVAGASAIGLGAGAGAVAGAAQLAYISGGALAAPLAVVAGGAEKAPELEEPVESAWEKLSSVDKGDLADRDIDKEFYDSLDKYNREFLDAGIFERTNNPHVRKLGLSAKEQLVLPGDNEQLGANFVYGQFKGENFGLKNVHENAVVPSNHEDLQNLAPEHRLINETLPESEQRILAGPYKGLKVEKAKVLNVAKRKLSSMGTMPIPTEYHGVGSDGTVQNILRRVGGVLNPRETIEALGKNAKLGRKEITAFEHNKLFNIRPAM